MEIEEIEDAEYTIDKIEQDLLIAKKVYTDCLRMLAKKNEKKEEVSKQELKEKNDLKGVYNDFNALYKSMLKGNPKRVSEVEKFISNLSAYKSSVASIKVKSGE
jgi:hypothetical protein